MRNLQDKLNRLASLIETNPSRAADEMDKLANALKAFAEALRNQPIRSSSGFAERVQIQVIGPDGEIKKSVDTGAV